MAVQIGTPIRLPTRVDQLLSPIQNVGSIFHHNPVMHGFALHGRGAWNCCLVHGK